MKNPFVPCWCEWLLLCCRHLFAVQNTDLFCRALPSGCQVVMDFGHSHPRVNEKQWRQCGSHTASCELPRLWQDFINLNRSVELSSAWLTHPGSQRGETSTFGKVALKDLFIFKADKTSECLPGHKVPVSDGRCSDRHSGDSWSFEEQGADTALAGEHRWFLTGAPARHPILVLWLRKCVSLWMCPGRLEMWILGISRTMFSHSNAANASQSHSSPMGLSSLLCCSNQYRHFTTLQKQDV